MYLHNLVNMEPDLVNIQKVSLKIKLDNISKQLTLFTFNPQLHTYKRAIYKKTFPKKEQMMKRLLKYCLHGDVY